MITVKTSKSGKCLPVLPYDCLTEGSPIPLEVAGLSPVFHIPRPIGIPLAFTVAVCREAMTETFTTPRVAFLEPGWAQGS